MPCSSARSARSLAGLLDRVEYVDAAEERGRRAVAHRRDLPRLALAAVESPAEDVRLRAADGLHGVPDVGGHRLVGRVAELAREPSLLDPVEALAGELEVVALHVDRPALVADDVDAAVDTGDQLLGGGAVRRGLERDVRHALQRHAGGGVGERAAVRALPPGEVRDAPVGLVAAEPPVADAVPALRLDALVVVAD